MASLYPDREVLERFASAYEGNARAHVARATERAANRQSELQHEADRWSEDEMLAASSLAIAASCYTLTAPRKAVQLYRRAADMYRGMGHDYWRVLSMASADYESFQKVPLIVSDLAPLNPQTVAVAMVANEVLLSSSHHASLKPDTAAEPLENAWRHFGNLPVGRLGIPLDQYGRFAQAIRGARERKDRDRFMGDARSYINRAGEVIRSAMHDEFHWRGLQSAILPAEPEAVAMSTAISTVSHEVFGSSMAELPGTDDIGRSLLEVGESMWRAAAEQGGATR
jgi:hypothetical protein